MPILEIELVGKIETPEMGLASRLAEAAAGVLGARKGAVWVRVRTLPAEDYAEDGGGPGPGVRPVFVRVLRRVVPAGGDLDREVEALTRALAGACGRPIENVHVVYEPAAAGRLAFGGKVVT